jgi:hypothetical protein
MLTYLALFRVAAWKSLSRVQRRFVAKSCIHPLLFRWQTIAAKTCLLVFAIVAVTSWLHPSGYWRELMTVFFVVLIGAGLFDLVCIALHQQRASDYIRDHAAEIQSAV